MTAPGAVELARYSAPPKNMLPLAAAGAEKANTPGTLENKPIAHYAHATARLRLSGRRHDYVDRSADRVLMNVVKSNCDPLTCPTMRRLVCNLPVITGCPLADVDLAIRALIVGIGNDVNRGTVDRPSGYRLKGTFT